MKQKKLKFSDVFKRPFKADDYGCYIWSKDDNMCFTNLMGDSVESFNSLQTITNILNGTIKKKISGNIQYQNGKIIVDDKPILLVRGWGYLTGGLNLEPKEAAIIQDEFAEWAVNKLKGNVLDN